MGVFTSKGGGGVATYTITTDGSTYTGTKSSNGQIISLGSDFSTVFQAIVSDIGSDPASIEIGAGTFDVKTEITINSSNITVKGQGTATVLNGHADLADGAELFKFGTNPSTGSEAIGNLTKGNQVITPTGGDTSAYSVDDYVFIRDETVIDTETVTRTGGEIHKIAAKDATTLTIYGEFYEDYNSTPTVELIETMISNITVQNLSITDSRTTTSAASGGALRFQFIDNVIVSNVDIGFWQTQAMSFNAISNIRIDNCYIHDIRVVSNLNYGIALAGPIQQATINNCNFKETRHSVVMTGGTDPHTGYFRDITVSNCSSRDPGSAGFDSHQGGKNIVYNACTVEGHSDKGSASSSGFTIRSPTTCIGCRVMNVDSRGFNIFESAGASGTSIIHCYVENCGGEGIKINAANINLNLSYNTIINAGDNGIEGGSEAGCCDDSMIHGNLIVNPGANGIATTGVNRISICFNTIINPTSDGINSLTSMTDSQVLCNYVNGGVSATDLNTSNVNVVVAGNFGKGQSGTAFANAATVTEAYANTAVA